MDGVFETIVGYCGGRTRNPSYHRIGDHMEGIQVRYDPLVLSYDQLLEIFWSEHDYSRQPLSRQYMNAVFVHNQKQKEAVLQSMGKLPGKVETEVNEFAGFYRAEDYHQKFYLQRYPEVKRDFLDIYPDFREFTSSTAAARVNGFLGGYGSRSDLEKIIPDLGLSTGTIELLRSKTRNRR